MELTNVQIKIKLLHTVTEYDCKQSKRKDYNRYALGLYFQAVDNVIDFLNDGVPLRQAILKSFNGSLADKCLKAVGLDKRERHEFMGR
jgi:hypothetical protein